MLTVRHQMAHRFLLKFHSRQLKKICIKFVSLKEIS